VVVVVPVVLLAPCCVQHQQAACLLLLLVVVAAVARLVVRVELWPSWTGLLVWAGRIRRVHRGCTARRQQQQQ
jgi:hypothetical protein